MRHYSVILPFALAGAVFSGNSEPATNSSNTYRPPVYQSPPARSYQSKPYVPPGSRSTTGVQPGSSANRPYVPPGSRSTTGVQPSRSDLNRSRSTGPKTQSTLRSQQNNSSKSKKSTSNVAKQSPAAQQQKAQNRPTGAQAGGAANQNTPRAANDNTPNAQARSRSQPGSNGSGDKRTAGATR